MTYIINLGTTSGDVSDLPIGQLNPDLIEGMMCLFDFTNPETNPNASGDIPVGAEFVDITGGPSAVVVAGTGGERIVNSADGVLTWDVVLGTTTADKVDLGNSHRFNVNSSWVINLWMMQALDGSTTTFSTWFQRSAAYPDNANISQHRIDSGYTGSSMRGTILPEGGATGIGPTASEVPSLARGTVHLVSLAFVPGVSVNLWHDGVLVGTMTSGVPTTLEPKDAASVWMAATGKGSIYRLMIEDRAISGRTEAAAVTAEYSGNASRLAALAA